MNKIIDSIKTIVANVFMYVFHFLPIKNNKLFFFSNYGSQYACNPKYITEYLISKNLVDKYEIVWSFTDPNSYSIPGIRKVKTMSLKHFYELSTAKIVITNFRTTSGYLKRKNQYYIQTWHSSLRLKQIEKDAEDSLPKNYVEMAKKDSSKLDLLLSGCSYSTQIFQRSFWFDGEIMESGTPRNDILLQNGEDRKRAIIAKLQIPIGKKVLLYAPTFRKSNGLEVYNLDYSLVIKTLKKKFGGDWLVLVRLHPHLISLSNKLFTNEHVRDVTSYDDIQELLLISDVLISDYSSLIFDFAITKRPCFLYVPDLEDYVANDRKLYFDIWKLPFINAADNNELMSKIENFRSEDYEKHLNHFLVKVGSYENGMACKKIVERFDEICFQHKRSEALEAV